MGLIAAEAKRVYVGKQASEISWKMIQTVLAMIDDYTQLEVFSLLPIIVAASNSHPDIDTVVYFLAYLIIFLPGREEENALSCHFAVMLDEAGALELMSVLNQLIHRMTEADNDDGRALLALSCVKYALANR